MKHHPLLPLLVTFLFLGNTVGQTPPQLDSLFQRAKTALIAKDFAQANQHLDQAWALASHDSLRAEVLVQQADAFKAAKKFTEAAAALEKMVALGQKMKRPTLQLDGYLKWLQVLTVARSLEEAAAVEARARALIETFDDPATIAEEMVQLENNVAIIAYFKKDLSAAIARYQVAVGICKKYQQTKKLPTLYDNIALGYFRSGMPDSAKTYLDLALQLATEQGDTLILSSSTLSLGNYFWQKGQLEKAVEYFGHCERWSKALGSIQRESIARISTGAVFGEMDQPEKALSAYFAALPLLEQWEPRELARSHGQIAQNFETLHDIPNARKHYRMALDISRANGSEAEDGMFLAGLARADWYDGLREDARQKIAAAKQTKDFGVNQSIRAHLALTEARFDLAEGRLEWGLQLLYEALEIFEKIDERNMAGAVLVEIGKAYQQLDEGQVGSRQYDVEALLCRGLDMARQVGNVKSERVALSALASFYEKNHQDALATPLLHQLLVLNDSLYAKNRTALVAQAREQYETEKKEQENTLLKAQNDLIGRQKNQLLIAAGVLALLLAGLGWLYFQMRHAKAKIGEQASQLAQLNATKDRLFAIISHDLRSEISAFTSLGKIFNFHLANGNLARLQELSKEVNRSANNLSTLLDNLLQWSVSQLEGVSLHPQPLDLRQQADEIIALFGQHAESKGIVLQSEIAPGLQAFADENSLQLVLRNLVSNALKFTPSGGQVSLRAQAHGELVTLVVHDTGPGIPPEKTALLFTLDRRGSSRGTAGERGTGLGLALSKEFAERNGGSLSIESKVGMGTTCRFTLPKVG